MWQTINLTSFTDPILIDGLTVKFNLSAWLGGYQGQNDRPAVYLTFRDQNNQTVGNMTKLGPVTDIVRSSVTKFLFEEETGLVPVGARLATVMVVITRSLGPINDGYVDGVNLFLHQ